MLFLVGSFLLIVTQIRVSTILSLVLKNVKPNRETQLGDLRGLRYINYITLVKNSIDWLLQRMKIYIYAGEGEAKKVLLYYKHFFLFMKVEDAATWAKTLIFSNLNFYYFSDILL